MPRPPALLAGQTPVLRHAPPQQPAEQALDGIGAVEPVRIDRNDDRERSAGVSAGKAYEIEVAAAAEVVPEIFAVVARSGLGRPERGREIKSAGKDWRRGGEDESAGVVAGQPEYRRFYGREAGPDGESKAPSC